MLQTPNSIDGTLTDLQGNPMREVDTVTITAKNSSEGLMDSDQVQIRLP